MKPSDDPHYLKAEIAMLKARNAQLILALKAIPCPPVIGKSGKPEADNAYKCQFSSSKIGRDWGGYCPFHQALKEI